MTTTFNQYFTIMLVIVDKNLDDIIPNKYRKLRKVVKNLRIFDNDIYRSIEDEIYEAHNNNPDEDEAADYFLENYKHILSKYSSCYIPAEFQEDDDEEDEEEDDD